MEVEDVWPESSGCSPGWRHWTPSGACRRSSSRPGRRHFMKKWRIKIFNHLPIILSLCMWIIRAQQSSSQQNFSLSLLFDEIACQQALHGTSHQYFPTRWEYLIMMKGGDRVTLPPCINPSTTSFCDHLWWKAMFKLVLDLKCQEVKYFMWPK